MTTGSGGPVAPPGWYPDGEGWERRWDGAAWTEDRRPAAPAADATIVRPPETGTDDPTSVRRGPLPTDAPTVMSVSPPLPPTPDPQDAIWPEDPAAQTPEAAAPAAQPGPEQAIWPADPAAEPPAGEAAGEAAAVQPPAAKPAPPPAFPPVAETQYGARSGQQPPHAPPNAAPAPPPAQAWSPAPPPPPAQAWSPTPGATPAAGGAAYAGFPQHSPPGGTGGPGGKKNLLWLWVVLAVVLVVLAGTAVTLLVTSPWSDDSGSTAEGGGGEGGEGGEDVPEAVTADINGDGKGDAIADLNNDSKLFQLRLTSSGTALTVEEQEVTEEKNLVWDDFDGDGTLDILNWTYTSSLDLRAEDDSIPGKSASIQTWADAPEIRVHPGDFDGDGLADVAVHAQTDQDTVTVWVLRNTGEGFEDAAEWATLDNTTLGSTSLFAGDWDADGTDDLLGLVPNVPLKPKEYDSGYFDRKMGVTLLEGGDSSFTVGPISPTNAEIHQEDLTVGDFTGEGKPMIAVEDSWEETVEVYEYDGTNLVTRAGFRLAYAGGDVGGAIEAITASDLDGDGKDDLLFVTYNFDTEQYEGFLVARSTGSAFGQVERWAETPRCKDFCYTEFEHGS